MSTSADPDHIYSMTIKMFGAQAEPAFETPEQQDFVWGRGWGCNNDVGQLRLVLMHRPGEEMNVVNPNMRIEEIGSFGDPEHGWYWQSDTVPPLAEMQAQHDALVGQLRAEGVEVVFIDRVATERMKTCYTRDSAIAVGGGAIVCRLAPKIRRGEELPMTRTLANLGMPILRTISGSGLMEGGSFAWINSKTAVVGRSIRVNEDGARQLDEVLRAQGVELLRVDLGGYDIHIDGAFVMVDVDTALVDPDRLPYWFLQKLEALGVRTVETTPDDDGWIVNCLAVRPGRVIMSPGVSRRTQDALDKLNIEIVTLPYDKMALNGSGIHCSTCPLVRDPVVTGGR